MRKQALLLALLGGILAGCGSGAAEDTEPNDGNGNTVEIQEDRQNTEDMDGKDTDKRQNGAAAAGSVEVTPGENGGPSTIAGIPIVNKKYGVSPDYAPGEDPTVAAAARQLIAAMQAEGLDVSDSWSGFRSYEYQSELYNGYVASSGQEAADTFSARPGFSEHQTGLAFDLKHSSGALLENPAEAQWLLDHAQEYGFIVRYQEGWEPVTGYMAEPWHIRYIGELAPEIQARNIPLETYLGAEGGGYAGE